MLASHVEAEPLLVVKTQPASVWREEAKLEVAILGNGLRANSVIRFLVPGTDKLGGIIVTGVRFLSSRELVALVRIESSVVPGAFDIEVQDASGEKARAERAFVVEPYSWAGRFSCTGAESWRRRIPCRRGAID
jgi:hypothetical protein